MKIRSYWLAQIEEAWQARPLVWLSGVRRVGKTVLSQSLDRTEYFDCELPRVRRLMDDPESFLTDHQGKRIVLDEIHRLENPTELLKIAADHFPKTRILATGSSTLQASAKFRDTRTGRKREIWLTPMMSQDQQDFGDTDLRHRLTSGGLPPFFLRGEPEERDFQEWIDSFWAKDIQELFRLERRHSFQRLLELLFSRSGGIFKATTFARVTELSRTSVSNYLKVLEATWVAHVIRPFSTRTSTEIISAPKVYAFDTGFVNYFKGWRELRQEDLGILWEHYVLNELQSRGYGPWIRYWRDKRGHEVDFVLLKHGKNPDVIECKWSADNFDARGMRAFRERYAHGANFVVAADVDRAFRRKIANISVTFVNIQGLMDASVS